MLPNHAPLVIAEQFGTLATLYPGRIDLGLGRAPGTDQLTMRALRRHLAQRRGRRLPARRASSCRPTWATPQPGQAVRAIPGIGTEVPIWLLGSSLYSAQLAALAGPAVRLRLALRARPAAAGAARSTARGFRPSADWPKPHAMVGVNVIAADTDDEAARLFTSIQQRFLGMQRGVRGPLPRPMASMDGLWSEAERLNVERCWRCRRSARRPACASPARVARR